MLWCNETLPQEGSNQYLELGEQWLGGGEHVSVADNICRIIQQKGFVKKDVAARAGFSAAQLANMIHGRKTIKADYIPRIADALGVGVAELFEK